MNRFVENPKQIRIAIITNVIPSYRYDFYRRVVNHDDLDVTIFCQSHIPGTNLDLIDKEFGKSAVRRFFWSLSREKLAWQFLPFRRLLTNFDVYFFYGNPRVLSNVIYATIFKLLGKKVVIWGQAHTWGADKLFESIRLAWWRVFDFILVYTGEEAESIRRRGFRRQVVKEINNGLDQEAIENAISMWPVVRASRRCPRPTQSSADHHSPASSGPRWRMASRPATSQSHSDIGVLEAIPMMPHIRGQNSTTYDPVAVSKTDSFGMATQFQAFSTSPSNRPSCRRR